MSDEVRKQMDIIKENFHPKKKVWGIALVFTDTHVNPALVIRRENREIAVELTRDIASTNSNLLNAVEAMLNTLEEDSEKSSHE
jgi:hypothetical protein